MRAHLQQRVAELKSEFEAGQKMLADLEHQQSTLRQTLWRISGAIQVLEEELAKFPEPAPSLEPSSLDSEEISLNQTAHSG